ncbi:MAG: hypothetical protein A3G24_16070 [Betaproteobacteria bacterium RIFCSPLOWO2_12_FULL_62_13]|nr:MAG: hypothetical protein A3G24_16070 [Betaproteobacteria bacterium RIFCSPLOWO2_12_FULL_62_13]
MTVVSVPPYAMLPTGRLVLGLGVSLAIHVAVILAITPAPYRYVPAQPLLVELLHEVAPQAPSQISAKAASEVSAESVMAAASQASEIHTSALPEAAAQPVTAPGEKLAVPAQAPEPIAAMRETTPQVNVPPDKYFTLREVDVRPEQINEVDLLYPRRAYALRTKGEVILRIFISDEGTIDEVSILDASPPGVFEEAALEAVLALRFKPAQKYGRNVKSQKTIEVVFDTYEKINVP